MVALVATTAPASAQSSTEATCANLVCGLSEPSYWLVIVVFNIAAIMLLVIACKAIDFTSALIEKSSLPATPPSPVDPNAPPAPPAPQSSSRVISALGGLLIVAFFWACCNVSVYWAFANPTNLTQFAQGVWPLFLAGSALFLPYAFNQLKGVFSS
jgi:hypothetical protein